MSVRHVGDKLLKCLEEWEMKAAEVSAEVEAEDSWSVCTVNINIKHIVVSQLSTSHPHSEVINQTVLDLNNMSSLDLFPPQGPGVLSGEQDVSSESGSGSGPDSISDCESGSGQTHQRVHHPPHAAFSGKNVTQHTLTVTYKLYTC